MNFTTSIETSERLKKLNIKQDAYFYWYHSIYNSFQLLRDYEIKRITKSQKLKEGEYQIIPAYTVVELINILGANFGVLERFRNGTFGAYIPNDCGVNGLGISPQEALANLIINQS